jgi:hypothetical protein
MCSKSSSPIISGFGQNEDYFPPALGSVCGVIAYRDSIYVTFVEYNLKFRTVAIVIIGDL